MERGDTLTYTGRLVVETCCNCHMQFAMPEEFRQRALDNRPDVKFYCPAGHVQWYIGKTAAQQLKDQLAAAERRAAYATSRADQAEADADHQRNRIRGYQGQLGLVKKRIRAGQCPTCTAEFPDLAQHMAAEHPGYESTVDGGA